MARNENKYTMKVEECPIIFHPIRAILYGMDRQGLTQTSMGKICERAGLAHQQTIYKILRGDQYFRPTNTLAEMLKMVQMCYIPVDQYASLCARVNDVIGPGEWGLNTVGGNG